METKSSNGLIIFVVILFVLVMVLGGYIGYDKILNNNLDIKENVEEQVENNTDEEDNFKVSGECPLTKFNGSYVLTDSDKEEIMNSLELLNAGFTKNTVDINTFKISKISESGYYINVDFDSVPNGNGAYASVTKVNNKFKVLIVGSGDSIDGAERMDDTLKSICE